MYSAAPKNTAQQSVVRDRTGALINIPRAAAVRTQRGPLPSSLPKEPEGNVRALAVGEHHRDPQQGHGLQEPGLRERSRVNRLEAERRRQAGYHLLGGGVVPAQEHARLLVPEP